MELPQVGKRCCRTDCERLDFLPFVCSECTSAFCQQHFSEHTLECIPRRVVNAKPDQTKHAQTCCECGLSSLMLVQCERCGRECCVSHRHVITCEPPDPEQLRAAKERVEAPRKQYAQAKATVDKQVEQSMEAARRKPKNSATVSKLQAMKLRAHATGDRSIPNEQRVHFLVHSDITCPAGRALFVSRNWSLGRATDAVARELGITCSAMLRLYRHCDRTKPLAPVQSVPMHQLLAEQAVNDGDSLDIELLS